MACFVDDPIIGVAGAEVFRCRLFKTLTLPWTALGFRLAWAKACRGAALVWIGVHIAIDMRLRTICLTIPADKLAKLVKHARDIISTKGVASRKLVRSFAGLGEWVAGVVPPPPAQSMYVNGLGRAEHRRQRYPVYLCSANHPPAELGYYAGGRQSARFQAYHPH